MQNNSLKKIGCLEFLNNQNESFNSIKKSKIYEIPAIKPPSEKIHKKSLCGR